MLCRICADSGEAAPSQRTHSIALASGINIIDHVCNVAGIFATIVDANAAKDVVAGSNAHRQRVGRGLAAAGRLVGRSD